METEQCGSSTTKEDSGGTTDEGTTIVAVTTMAETAAGGTLTILEIVRTRVSTTSKTDYRSSGEIISNSNNSKVMAMVDGRETPEEEDSGMVGEGVPRMIGSRVHWGLVAMNRNEWKRHRCR